MRRWGTSCFYSYIRAAFSSQMESRKRIFSRRYHCRHDLGGNDVVCLPDVSRVRPRFWHAAGGCYMLFGVCCLLTLCFLKSSVCTRQGCRFGPAAVIFVVAGVVWFVAGSFCFVAAVRDAGGKNRVVNTRVEITEYVEPDGVRITETTTFQSNGMTIVQRRSGNPPFMPQRIPKWWLWVS